jgi:hypothetical protein
VDEEEFEAMWKSYIAESEIQVWLSKLSFSNTVFIKNQNVGDKNCSPIKFLATPEQGVKVRNNALTIEVCPVLQLLL